MTHYERCAVDGCARRPRRFSRMCQHHFQCFERTRHPSGRIVRKQTLAPHRTTALKFIQTNADHPATQAALEFMADLLEPKDTAGFLRGEFDRLNRHGVTPATMLASALAWYSWCEWIEWTPGVYLGDRWADCNLGRAILNTAPAKTRVSGNGKTYYVRVRGNHAEALGKHTRLTVGLFLLMAAKQLKQHLTASNTARDAIRESLDVPFSMEAINDTKEDPAG